MRLNDDWYELGGFSSQHSGGDQIIRRFAGSDVTALFYSNHFDGFDTKLQRLERHRTARPSGESGLPHLDSHNASVPLSDLYAALKMEVKVALASAAPGRGHRARFPLRPLLARYAVLGLAAAAAATSSASVSAAAVPAAAGTLHLSLSVLYGLMIGQAMWTHGHTAVHDPDAVTSTSSSSSSLDGGGRRRPWMGPLLAFDLANVPALWLREHQQHHAATNSAEDPDTRWFMPAIDYRRHAAEHFAATTTTTATATTSTTDSTATTIATPSDTTATATATTSTTTTATTATPTPLPPLPPALVPVLLYPLLVPFMGLKSLRYALAHDPAGETEALRALALAPLRFALDLCLLGVPGLAAALAAATAYLCATFVATHAAGPHNYHQQQQQHQQQQDHHHYHHHHEQQQSYDRGEDSSSSSSSSFSPTGDFLVDQLASTNNVAPRSALFSWLCGGINCHIEHHLFPMVAPELLPAIAPVVEGFARRHGLPYRSYPHPAALWADHARFLLAIDEDGAITRDLTRGEAEAERAH